MIPIIAIARTLGALGLPVILAIKAKYECVYMVMINQ